MSLILHVENVDGNIEELVYDPYKLTLQTEDGKSYEGKAKLFGNPDSNPSMRLIIGKNCNLHCSYCSQEPTKCSGDYLTNARKDKAILNKTLNTLVPLIKERNIDNLTFWGGEPLLYFKQIPYIVEYLKDNGCECSFSTLTNGTLLNEKMVKFFIDEKFYTTISHDGPNHSILRGRNLLEDKILSLVQELATESGRRFSFNSVIHKHNQNQLVLFNYLSEKIGHPVRLAVVDPLILLFDDASKYLIPDEELPEYTRRFYQDFYNNKELFFEYFSYYRANIHTFLKAFYEHKPIPLVDHCKTIKENVYVTDLYGNVLTCQNEDPFSKTENGESHLRGTIFKMNELTSPIVGSWNYRSKCLTCPVLHICRNKCPHTPERLHSIACKQYFHHYLVLFSMAITAITGGGILHRISGDFFHAKGV